MMHPVLSFFGHDDDLVAPAPSMLAAGPGPDATTLAPVDLSTYAKGAAFGAVAGVAVGLVAAVAASETYGTQNNKALAAVSVLAGGGAMLGLISVAMGVGDQRKVLVQP